MDAIAGTEPQLGLEPPAFEVVVTHDGRCSTVRVIGELDLATSEVLAVTLEGIRASGERRVVVDLSDTFVDVAGLRPLEQAAIDGLAIRIRNPRDLTRKLLLLTGLDRRFAVDDRPPS